MSGPDVSQNPRKVLKRLADAFVPFVESKMAENIARWMHAKTEDEARTIRLPFPLDVYVSTVLDIWSFGGIRNRKRRS